MMLRTFLPDIKQRYVFAGTAVGAILPITFYGFDVWQGGTSGLLTWAMENPSQFTLAAMPAWMGLVGLQFGRSRVARMGEEAERRRHEAMLHHAAHFDKLTGLANRNTFERDMCTHLRAGLSPAIYLMDLDKFKYVNDTMGHGAGDELLAFVAKRLAKLTSFGVDIYRMGGDEFVFVDAQGRGQVFGIRLAEELKALFALPFQLEQGPARVGASVGVAYTEPGDETYGGTLKRADLALYKAKETPGLSCCFFEQAMADEAISRLRIERDLLEAISGDGLFLAFQPIVSTESRKVRSFEALLRWQHPEFGLMMPDEFFPAAEKSGLIMPLGRWVMRNACLEAAKWPSPTGVAVNVAGDQFGDPQFVPFVKACLEEAGLAPGRLTIEITESVFSVEIATIKESLEQLRAMGIRIALDDFGIGFASINNLREFPLDQLKLGKSFAQSLFSDADSSELMHIMMQLGATFKLSTTIEGIENEVQMDFVRERGAQEVQGYLFSEPVRAEDVEALLKKEEAEGKHRAA